MPLSVLFKIHIQDAIFFSVVNICIESHCMQWQLDFWTTDFSYFKNVSKFIILIRLWDDSNPGPIIISQATKPLY